LVEVDDAAVCRLELVAAGVDKGADVGVGYQVARLAQLDAVNQGISGQVAVDEGWTGADAFEAEPQHEVFRRVAAVDGHDLMLLDAEFLDEPVPYPAYLVVELLVGVCPALEDEEEIGGGLRVAGPVLEVVVDQHAVVSHALVDELLGCC